MQANRQIKTILAENLEAARKDRGLSRNALATLIGGVDPNYIYRWERELVAPNLANMQALADALGHDVAWFYTDHSREPDGDETPIAA